MTFRATIPQLPKSKVTPPLSKNNSIASITSRLILAAMKSAITAASKTKIYGRERANLNK